MISDTGTATAGHPAHGWDAVSEAMPDAVIHTDVNRIIRKVNPSFMRIFGYPPEEIIGKSTMEIYAVPRYYHEEGNLRFNPDSNADAGPYETCYRRRDGEWFTATSMGTRMLDDTGAVSGFMLVVRDDRENRQMASDYVRLATAVDQATENVVITDPEGRIQYVNPSFERTTGYTREEVLGMRPDILKSGAHDDAFYRNIWDTILAGQPWSGQIKNKRKDGSLYKEDCIISPVFAETGEIINFVGVKHDITRTLALEEQHRQSQRIESLGRLAGGVAHDINNLLFPILGYTEILLDELSNDSLIRDPVEQIRNAGIKVRNLVRQLLAFSRRQTLEVGPQNLNAVISGFKKLMRKTVREDVEMVFDLKTDLPLVMADLGQVEQILMNLLVNAQYAMPDGGKICIETGVHHRGDLAGAGADEDRNPFAYVRITDNGHGMDDATQKRIFEPFFTTRKQVCGTGLGLSTVYGIVKQHNGYIDVDSSPGEGAVFTVSLPVTRVPDVELRKTGKSESGPQTQPPCLNGEPRPRAMLADDNPMAVGFARKALERLGYKVVMAGDSRDCIEFMDAYQGPLDLLLSDVIMPRVNGRQLQGILREKVPGLKTLFMSGYSHDVIARHGHLEKGLNFIAKPFSKAELAVKLEAMGAGLSKSS